MSIDQRSGPVSRVFGVLKTLVSITLALAGLALFLAWMGGAFHEKVPPGVGVVERPQSAGRTLLTVESSMQAETITAVGSVQPRQKTEVASRLLATILEIRPRPGDRISKNDPKPLIILDDRELLAQQREAVATLTATEADLVSRKSDYDRQKALKASGSASNEEFTRIEGLYRITEAQVTRAKETINRLDIQLSYAKIAATADGIVSDRFAEPGDLATPGKPILTIYDPSDLELQANVPESLASGLTVGQKLNVRVDANNYSAQAVIREIVPQAQQASRSVLVKLALPLATANPVLPGMYGRVVIPVGQAKHIWIPQSVVVRRGQLDLVEVADAEGFLSRRFVRLGRESEDKVEILSGLAPGDRVAFPAQKQD
ncbi:multidrug efflux RND transporter periplasmic adaptor subunit MexV [soil metagenome]